MAGLFKNSGATQDISERQRLEARCASARSYLLVVVIFTAINIILLVTESNRYFLFSAFIPYIMMAFGMLYCGMHSDSYYEGMRDEYAVLDETTFAVIAVLSALIILLYLFCWIFSKKHRIGWLITAAIFFGLDTAGMLLFYGFSVEAAFDILFHGFVMYSLINGIISYYKLQKLPPEDLPNEQTTDEVPVELETADEQIAQS